MAEITQTRTTAAEFAQLPETTQPTELINGEIVVSPSPRALHQKVVFELAKRIEAAAGKGEVLIAPMDVYLDSDNVVQPDVFWVTGEDSLCKLGEDDYWHGAPDLIVEVISPGSTRTDKVTKFELYEKHGVVEYWLADPEAQTLEVWVRTGEDKETYTRQGVYTNSDSFTSVLLASKTLSLKGIFPE